MFSHEDGITFALVHHVCVVSSGNGCDGLEQDDGLFMGTTDESGSDNLDCGLVEEVGTGRELTRIVSSF